MTEKEMRKSKIRERYKGADIDRAEIIPARKQADFYDDVERRVAVYVRVSTDNLQQTSSYELQKNYYEDMIIRNPKWSLAGIYADEGITGTSLEHRKAFNQMIEDCEKGKIDMIITKSVSRFARNIRDCIETLDKLKKLPNPVGIFFETENIFSLNSESEMSLNIISTMAQEESHVKSSIMNASIEMRFSHGILLTPVLLGYDHDDNGDLIINEEEAKTVHLIFFMYLYGYTCEKIASELERLGRKTKKGSTKWTASSIVGVLKNERHCGDVLAHKTFTPDYRDHKSKKNKGDKTQYIWRDNHDAIISRSDFIAVQQLLDNAKYKNTNILPDLKVITEGALRGFVSINPRWSGFKAEDYIRISEGALKSNEDNNETIEAQAGDFDFRGYELVRTQLFNTSEKICVTFTVERVKFGTGALRRLGNCRNVEMLICPKIRLFAVRPCDADNKNSVLWNSIDNRGKYVPRVIGGKAFLKTLYELADWNTMYKYCARGIKLRKGNDCLLIFNMNEPEVFMPRNMINAETITGDMTKLSIKGNYVSLFSVKQERNFGENFYRYLRSVEEFNKFEALDADDRAIAFSELEGLDVSTAVQVNENINKIIDDIKEDGNE